MRVGSYLKEARKARGLTQGQVALRLKCTPQYVFNYEKGLPISDKHLKTLIPVLELNKDELVRLLTEEVLQKVNNLYQEDLC